MLFHLVLLHWSTSKLRLDTIKLQQQVYGGTVHHLAHWHVKNAVQESKTPPELRSKSSSTYNSRPPQSCQNLRLIISPVPLIGFKMHDLMQRALWQFMWHFEFLPNGCDATQSMQRLDSWVDLSIPSIPKEGLNGPEGFTWRLSGLDRVRLAVSFFSGFLSCIPMGNQNRQSHRGVWFRPLHLTLEPLEEPAITWPPPGGKHIAVRLASLCGRPFLFNWACGKSKFMNLDETSWPLRRLKLWTSITLNSLPNFTSQGLEQWQHWLWTCWHSSCLEISLAVFAFNLLCFAQLHSVFQDLSILKIGLVFEDYCTCLCFPCICQTCLCFSLSEHNPRFNRLLTTPFDVVASVNQAMAPKNPPLVSFVKLLTPPPQKTNVSNQSNSISRPHNI